jgi:peptidoglycan/LPS O-acetylase OafA/YrhL
MELASPLAYFILWALVCLYAYALSSATGWGSGITHRAAGQYFAGIDGLRGILAMNIFFHHSLVNYYYLQTSAWFLPPSNFYAQLGPMSVTMFFFVTGFLFWTKAIASPGDLSPRKFFIKRLRRLMPAYFHVLVPLRDLVVEVGVWALCGLPHRFLPINSMVTTQVNAGVFWTLRVEWAFYLSLPLLGWFATKTRVFLLFLLCGLTVKLYDVAWHPSASIASVASGVEIFRMWGYWMIIGFGVGMMAAHVKADRKIWSALLHPACTVVAVLLLAVVFFLAPPRTGVLESALLAPIFLMIVFGNDFHGLLTSRPIAYLGDISYSVYLLHGIVLYVFFRGARRLFHFVPRSLTLYWVMVGVLGAVLVLLASVSYQYLELGFMGRKGKAAGDSETVSEAGASV